MVIWDEENRIRDALRHIDAHDRDTWVRMAMAVKSELGEAGFALWDTWSQSASNYDARAAKDVWRSIKPDGKVSIGSLFYEARANGWRDDPPQQPIAANDAERMDTARKAMDIWGAASEAGAGHPYLKRKGVAPVPTLREIDAERAAQSLGYTPTARGEPLAGRLLVVPVKQGDRLATLELIDEAGRKSALAGRGTKAGGYWATAKLPQDDGATLLIGEGVATAASASEATGHVGVAALTCTNLQAVARAMRQRYPNADIIVLADIDKASDEPIRYAVEAARAAGARLAVPDFGADRAPKETDFNDLHQRKGLEAVRCCIEAASQPAAPGVQLLSASSIKPEPVRWLWDGWLAAGKLHILAGRPGCGKTTLALGLAATVTTAGRWPDGTHCPEPGDVVIWSSEDDPADTLVPRLMAAAADTRRVHFVGDVRTEHEARPFDPAADMPALAEVLEKVRPRLLILDPIVSAVAADSHKNGEVRRALQPVVDLAARLGCAVLGITHLSKGTNGRDPTERITGSIAFAALARVVLLAAKRENTAPGEATRLLVRSKSNLGADDGGIGYDLEQTEVEPGVSASRVVWAGVVTGAARELLAQAEAVDDDEGAAVAGAMAFLRGLLEDGPMTANEIKRDADAAGYSWRTVHRAADRLGVEKRKEGGSFGGRGAVWRWRLPHTRCQQDDKMPSKKGWHLVGSLASCGQAPAEPGADDVVEVEL